jgi:hypothetical protein
MAKLVLKTVHETAKGLYMAVETTTKMSLTENLLRSAG